LRGLAQNGLAAGTKYRDEKPMRTCCMVERPQKITLGKMRASGYRDDDPSSCA
jgi:hypothetical protein